MSILKGKVNRDEFRPEEAMPGYKSKQKKLEKLKRAQLDLKGYEQQCLDI